ncbi:hypothetical protein ACOMHN_028749 [Nucella lapillus]
MMSGVLVCFCLLSTQTAGTTAPASAGSSSPGTQLLQALRDLTAQQEGMKQVLKSLQQGLTHRLSSQRQAQQLPYFVVGCGSGSRLSAIENKLVALEEKQKTTETELRASGSRLAATEARLESARAASGSRLAATEARLESARAALRSNKKPGSTFVRWGRKTCTNNSHTVYCGIAGGSFWNHPGASANRLCLPMTPQFTATPVPLHHGLLYGTEYDNIPHHHDHDVPCCVCRVPQSTTLMVPATRACPTGWTTQYTGYLASGDYDHKAASKYVCLDRGMENASRGPRNHNQNQFYYTVTRCGSLPCPPYVNNQVALCAVCSK